MMLGISLECSDSSKPSALDLLFDLACSHHPSILAATPLGGIDYQRAFDQSDTGQSAWNDVNVFAVEYVGSKIHMPALEGISA
jgi:hypothetical protein